MQVIKGKNRPYINFCSSQFFSSNTFWHWP